MSAQRAKGILWSIVGTLVAGLAFGGWQARDYIDTKLATKDQVRLAMAQAEFVLDRQMEAVISQIAYLERKSRLTPGEADQLRYLRQQLQEMRRVRSGK